MIRWLFNLCFFFILDLSVGKKTSSPVVRRQFPTSLDNLDDADRTSIEDDFDDDKNDDDDDNDDDDNDDDNDGGNNESVAVQKAENDVDEAGVNNGRVNDSKNDDVAGRENAGAIIVSRGMGVGSVVMNSTTRATATVMNVPVAVTTSPSSPPPHYGPEEPRIQT